MYCMYLLGMPNIFCSFFNASFYKETRSVTSHVALRCPCYYHCAQTIYYNRVPVQSVNNSALHLLQSQSAMAMSTTACSTTRKNSLHRLLADKQKGMKVFVHCLQVLLKGVSFKSWGWSISHTSQKNACKTCRKLLVLSGLNLSQGCVQSCRTILICKGKNSEGV